MIFFAVRANIHLPKRNGGFADGETAEALYDKKMEGENDMPVVTTIPATKPRYAAQKAKQKKRRAAAYARVSTDHEEQQNS